MMGSGTSTGRPGHRLHLRGLPSDNPQEPAVAAGAQDRAQGRDGGPDRPGGHADRSARAGAPLRAAAGGRHPLHPLPRGPHLRARRRADLQLPPARGRSPATARARRSQALRRIFAYVFEAGQEGGGKPQLDLIEVREPFELLGRDLRARPGVARRDGGLRLPDSAASPTSPTATAFRRRATGCSKGWRFWSSTRCATGPIRRTSRIEEAIEAARADRRPPDDLHPSDPRSRPRRPAPRGDGARL